MGRSPILEIEMDKIDVNEYINHMLLGVVYNIQYVLGDRVPDTFSDHLYNALESATYTEIASNIEKVRSEE